MYMNELNTKHKPKNTTGFCQHRIASDCYKEGRLTLVEIPEPSILGAGKLFISQAKYYVCENCLPNMKALKEEQEAKIRKMGSIYSTDLKWT